MIDRGVLYIVATPIGNLDDISLRAVSTLKSVDCVAAEDTRHSQKLLNHLGIQQTLIAYHDHSSEKQTERILSLLDEGKSVALISDAGTPLISDPGYRIVALARKAKKRVVPIPGASAPIAALSASGVATDRFTFEGFLPAKSSARKHAFEGVLSANVTTVFFESPHRIVDAIEDAISVLGAQRSAVLARELTKNFETFLGSNLGDIRKAIAEDANQKRGEMVFIIGAVASKEEDGTEALSEETVALVKVLAAELPTKQAASLAAQITGEQKKKLYELALTFKS